MNTFVTFLDLLKVKHTKSFSNQYFNEHPHKNNLYGLSKILTDYGVRNAGTQIEDREKDIFNIECPFVAYMGGDFVGVYGIDPEKVHYLRNGKKFSIPVVQFIQSWSGIALLAEPSSDSIEPDYTIHRKKGLLTFVQKSILALACILFLGIAYINTYISPVFISLWSGQREGLLGFSLLLLVNLTGIYICYLLVLKQLHIESRYAYKICTLFSQSDCNNVLESDAAKLFGVFGWSEIGMGYFVANTIILLFLPHQLLYSAIVNILALPYTVWSIWYQKVKARHWCPLCLIVQILLWTIFLINLIFGYINIPLWRGQGELEVSIFIYQLIFVGCIYVIPIFTLNLLLPKLSEGNQVDRLRQAINSLKANDELFKTLLLQQPFYEVSRSDTQILFGNPDAKLIITILTNPFCNPCAKMHVRVEKLLKETKGNICIQYIFSSFNEDLNYANRYMIAAYFDSLFFEKETIPLRRGQEDAAWQLFSDWFTKGKALKEAFFEKLQLNISNPAIEEEFQKHVAWKEKTQLRATPTILINGYKLPENYKIEDLQFFSEFDVNIK